jgi:hypothetical protein
MADLQALSTLFESFCAFGSTRNLNGSMSNLSGSTMDGSKWAKFTRDCKVLSPSVTPTECDIVFNKVKAKNERKIDFMQFQECLKLVAAKKYPQKPPSEAFVHLVQFILKQEAAPKTSSTTSTSKNDITARLTDPTLYTGRHKQTHDSLKSTSTGSINKVGVSSARSSSTGLNKPTSGSTSKLNGDYAKLGSTSGLHVKGLSGSSTNVKEGGKRTFNSVNTPSVEKLDKQHAKKSDTNSSVTKLNEKSGSGSVYDRLTDHKLYAGTHKHRFDEHGNGKGLMGRDSPTKGSGTIANYRGGNVTSLAQILRS